MLLFSEDPGGNCNLDLEWDYEGGGRLYPDASYDWDPERTENYCTQPLEPQEVESEDTGGMEWDPVGIEWDYPEETGDAWDYECAENYGGWGGSEIPDGGQHFDENCCGAGSEFPYAETEGFSGGYTRSPDNFGNFLHTSKNLVIQPTEGGINSEFDQSFVSKSPQILGRESEYQYHSGDISVKPHHNFYHSTETEYPYTWGGFYDDYFGGNSYGHNYYGYDCNYYDYDYDYYGNSWPYYDASNYHYY